MTKVPRDKKKSSSVRHTYNGYISLIDEGSSLVDKQSSKKKIWKPQHTTHPAGVNHL
jgi:hypothetical protein